MCFRLLDLIFCTQVMRGPLQRIQTSFYIMRNVHMYPCVHHHHKTVCQKHVHGFYTLYSANSAIIVFIKHFSHVFKYNITHGLEILIIPDVYANWQVDYEFRQQNCTLQCQLVRPADQLRSLALRYSSFQQYNYEILHKMVQYFGACQITIELWATM